MASKSSLKPAVTESGRKVPAQNSLETREDLEKYLENPQLELVLKRKTWNTKKLELLKANSHLLYPHTLLRN